MDLSFFLSSLNKISIVAFIITLIVLSYEIYLFKRDKDKKSMPQIPEFDGIKLPDTNDFTTLNIGQNQQILKKSNNLTITVLIIFLAVFGLMFFLGSTGLGQTFGNQSISPTPVIKMLYSKGIFIFDAKWKELNDKDIKNLKPGDRIIIGIDKVNNNDIEMARIRVNQSEWNPENTTLNINKEHNIFYQNYQIASSESKLEIEAQVYSKTNGWLGK